MFNHSYVVNFGKNIPPTKNRRVTSIQVTSAIVFTVILLNT